MREGKITYPGYLDEFEGSIDDLIDFMEGSGFSIDRDASSKLASDRGKLYPTGLDNQTKWRIQGYVLEGEDIRMTVKYDPGKILSTYKSFENVKKFPLYYEIEGEKEKDAEDALKDYSNS